ncbi:MAG: RDD family protein [Blastocatellia bacterium]|nr:RDD family protein [Blastocatellia bacterium]
MKCQVCTRELAPTLSICPTCGAMMNDTVREELETKMGKTSGPLSLPPRQSAVSREPRAPMAPPALVAQVRELTPPGRIRPSTTQLPVNKTSPTLVEFQAKNATIPDWRVQLQNSVRQRTQNSGAQTLTADGLVLAKHHVAEPAAAATVAAPSAEAMANEKVANAMKRIENSRRAFSTEPRAKSPITHSTIASKNFPFNVVSRSDELKAPPAPEVSALPKPILVSPRRPDKKTYDTNKLPPLQRETSPELPQITETPDIPLPVVEVIPETPVAAVKKPISLGVLDDSTVAQFAPDIDLVTRSTPELSEDDDLAPFATRFGAGSFDCVLGGLATAIILSPFMSGGGAWFSIPGIFALGSAFSIFMFLYLTASVGWWGKSFGMRLFSIELIDADENAYPTVHQAAVNSAVYLLSLALGGIGFLTIFFTDERRAAHDLISGTVIVRDN